MCWMQRLQSPRVKPQPIVVPHSQCELIDGVRSGHVTIFQREIKNRTTSSRQSLLFVVQNWSTRSTLVLRVLLTINCGTGRFGNTGVLVLSATVFPVAAHRVDRAHLHVSYITYMFASTVPHLQYSTSMRNMLPRFDQ
jgi:hypothetical protein